MSLPTDPSAQLSRLVELNTDIAEARQDLAVVNRAAVDTATAAGKALEHLKALEADRDELLESMKNYTTGPATAPDTTA